ncbi:hypothetical protein FB45DRAFT_703754, partial [Roridomyces roridus]
MKFSSVLVLAAAANAQYFSDGWKPGQAVTAEPAAPTIAGGRPGAPSSQPAQTPSLSSFFDINNLLNSGPVKGAFAQFGINITEKLEAAAATPWDDRIPMITDENYRRMVLEEELTPEEEEQRVWVIAVSTTSNRQEGISKFVDAIFDETYNATVVAGDLPHVRFARIDYLNVTYVTTRWNLWNAPAIVIAKDRGQTLRFYHPNQLRMGGGALREFIKLEGWEVTPPWSGAFAPGGQREFVLEFVAVWLTKLYLITIRIPRWLMILLSGSAASFLINFFHGFGSSSKPKAAAPPRTAA